MKYDLTDEKTELTYANQSTPRYFPRRVTISPLITATTELPHENGIIRTPDILTGERYAISFARRCKECTHRAEDPSAWK